MLHEIIEIIVPAEGYNVFIADTIRNLKFENIIRTNIH
jgi:hypothetical protein